MLNGEAKLFLKDTIDFAWMYGYNCFGGESEYTNEEIEEKIEEMGYDLNDFRFLSCCLCGGN